MKLTIDRKLVGDNCIQGYMSVNDSPSFYSLEFPWTENIKYLSSIPAGVYHAKIRTDGKLGWRLELIDVPGREEIEIHVGNYTKDVKGCLVLI